MTDKDREGRQHRPPPTWSMKFCVGCGRNDLQQSLGPRHFSRGERCTGQIITVKYKRKELDHAKH